MGKLFSTTNTDNATVNAAITDVQDATGASFVSGDIATIPMASTDKNGLVKLKHAYQGGITTESGLLVLSKNNLNGESGFNIAERVTSNHFYAVTTKNMDNGLKAAMCDGVGAAWSDDEKSAARARIGASNITEIQDADGHSFISGDVATIPAATAATPGLVKSDSSMGTRMETGAICAVNADDESITTRKAYRTNGYGVISTANFDKAVKEAVTADSTTYPAYSDTEKAAARNRIGAIDNTYHDNSKVDKELNSSSGKSLVFNEEDGGGAKFQNTDNTWSYVGVNNGGATGIAAQIYAVDASTTGYIGAKLDVTKSGMYYTTGEASGLTPVQRDVAANEIVVKGDLDKKQDLLVGDSTHGIDGLPFNIPYYFHTTPATDKITVSADTVKFENGTSAGHYNTFSMDVPAATTTSAGLMSAADKDKLDKSASQIDLNNEKSSRETADNNLDTKKLDIPGADPISGKTYNLPYYFYTEDETDKITVHAKTITLDNNKTLGNYTLEVKAATTEKAGLMSKDDKIQITNNTANITAEITRATTKENEIQANLMAEITRATAEEAKKVEKLIASGSNKSLIFNEVDGGGSKYEHADGTWSYVGVHDGGANGVDAQVYAVDSTDGYKGTKLDVKKDGIYYTTGEASVLPAAVRDVAANELATKGNVTEEATIRESVDNTKQDLLKGDATHGIDGLPFNIPYFFYTTPGADKVTVYADTVKFENGESALHYNTFSMDVNAATSTTAGLMSNVDKVKLDDLVKVSGVFDDANWQKITIDGVERNIPNASGIKSNDTLLANNWVGNIYSLEDIYPSAEYDIDVELANTADENEYQDFADAVITGNATNNILTALGTVPTINIPVIITKRAR